MVKQRTLLVFIKKENNLNIDTEYFGEGLIKRVILYSLNQTIKYKSALKLDVYIETSGSD
jgi:hypothetical protein